MNTDALACSDGERDALVYGKVDVFEGCIDVNRAVHPYLRIVLRTCFKVAETQVSSGRGPGGRMDEQQPCV